MSLSNVQVVLSGMSNEEQIIDNIQTFSGAKPLKKRAQEWIEETARLQHPSVAAACT